MSVVSAGCLIWLDALRPLFALTAAAALAFQGWLVWRRPAGSRTRLVWVLLTVSIATNAAVVLVWGAAWLRYR